MLLDNKTAQATDPTTVYEFIRQYLTKPGTFDVVTGYFSAAALAHVSDDLSQHLSNCRLVIGDTQQLEQEGEKLYDLLNDDLSVDRTFTLSHNAAKAITFLQQPTVEARTLRPNFCHAKAYIYHAQSQDKRDHFYVMGSSNLTEAGLGLRTSGNLELNTADFGGGGDYKELRAWYEELWKRPETRSTIKNALGKDVDFKQHVISLLQDLSRQYSPREVYEKVLFELFAAELLAWESRPDIERQIKDLRETEVYQALLPFQKQGVLSLIRMLQTYGGAILADAVGLGKTWQALAIIKFFEMAGREVIVLCPKKLESNWRRWLKGKDSRFEEDQFDYVIRYHTDLTDDYFEHQNKSDYKSLRWFQNTRPKLIVVDESHNLRNDKSSRYKWLVEKLLEKNRDVKVLLLSATPINTQLTDVRNQFKLLVKGQNNGFADVPGIQINSLQHAFADVQHKFEEWQKEPAETRLLATFIQHLPKPFFDLTDRLIVARTRKQIQGKDLGLHFPKKEKPENIYVGIEQLGGLKGFDSIFQAFRTNLTAYRPMEYTKPKKEVNSILEDEQARERFLVRMMMVLLVKRLESSWHSFGVTVGRILAHHENALQKVDAFQGNRKAAAMLDGETDEETLAALEEMEPLPEGEAPELTLGKKNPVALSSLTELPKFRQHLEKDLLKLRALHAHVRKMEATVQTETGEISVDKKLERLISEIRKKRLERPNQKVIIFTVFHDTADYLFKQLKIRGFSRMVMISGQGGQTDDGTTSKQFEPLLERFAPYTKLYNERDWRPFYEEAGLPANTKLNYTAWEKLLRAHKHPCVKQLDQPLDLLIATDCLSEGQNLQDADCVINYDIHWNPVRLIQRMGRVDRLGSPNESVVGYNFWPAKSYDDYLNLKGRVEKRMALLSLVGAEFEERLTPEMEAMLAGLEGSDLASKQAERMLQQMQTTWDDLETSGRELSFDDFSLEPFRQELLDIMRRQQDKYRKMPHGIFTGFKALSAPAPDGKPYPAPGMIALLGHPRRPQPAPANHHYDELYLAYAAPGAPARFVNNAAVLTALSRHSRQTRFVPEAIEDGKANALQELLDQLDGWLAHHGGGSTPAETAPAEVEVDLDNLFTFGITGAPAAVALAPKTKSQLLLEDKFQQDQFDLVCWFAVSDSK
jgi:superfamily II DNA or RNA helicase